VAISDEGPLCQRAFRFASNGPDPEKFFLNSIYFYFA